MRFKSQRLRSSVLFYGIFFVVTLTGKFVCNVFTKSKINNKKIMLLVPKLGIAQSGPNTCQ